MKRDTRIKSVRARLCAAWLLLGLAAPAAAQNLYVSDMATYFRNSGSGFCEDIRGTFQATITSPNNVQGTYWGSDVGWSYSAITGTRMVIDPDTGGCAATSSTATIMTAVFGDTSASGTLYGIGAGYARGDVTVGFSGLPQGTNNAQTVYCVATDSAGVTSEGFETGNFTGGNMGWGVDGWVVQTATRDTGSYAAWSGVTPDGSANILTLGIHTAASGNMSFRYRVSSLNGFDYLTFYDNCTPVANFTGETGWQTYNHNLTADTIHVLRWVYTRNPWGFNSGDNAAFIDNVSLPVNTSLYRGNSTAGASMTVSMLGYESGSNVIVNFAQQDTLTNTLYTQSISGPLTCSSRMDGAGTTAFWRSNSQVQDRVRKSDTATFTGTLSAPKVFPDVNVSSYTLLTGEMLTDSARIEFERPKTPYPGACLGLCAAVECAVTTTPITFSIDTLTFEVFKFGPGANPLDPSSTPPIKTISIFPEYATCDFPQGSTPGRKPVGIYCTAWDGTYNLNGFFGKTNGNYGYRARVASRQTTNQGTSIDIEQTSAYPGENQIPIRVDVNNIHMVQSSPTAVGSLTKVPSHPYNLRYRLSKDATATITIWDTDVSHRPAGSDALPLVRTVIDGQPRVGEGTPDGTLTNGDFWDGRDDNGNLVPAGSYVARIDSSSNDMWSLAAFNGGVQRPDLAWPSTIQLTLDPLQITDIGVKPLGASSTDQAIVTYTLTEAATAYVEIYTPGTVFSDVNQVPPVPVGGTGTLLRRFTEEKPGRQPVNTYWDGRDAQGRPVCDGDYVYAVYAELPSSGTFGSAFSWNSVKTKRSYVGALPVARGSVVTFLQPSSTVIGSTPPAGGLNPFYFRYTPTRNLTASLRIKEMDGVSTVRTLFSGEPRFSNMVNNEAWDGRGDDGRYVSSGTYLAELVTVDPFVCAQRQVSTTTALIPVNLFRIVNVAASPLLGGNTAYAAVGFELSQSMFTEFKVYPASVTLAAEAWPPVVSVPPVYSVSGLRPGRMRVTEPWDGRNSSGEYVPDGRYPYSLVAYTTGTAQTMYATDKVYGYVDVARGQILFSSFDVYPTVPTMYSSSDIVKLPPYGIEYSLTRIASVTVAVATMDDPPRVMAYVAKGEVREGDTLHKDFWDGRCTESVYCPLGDFLPDGLYNVVVTARDLADPLRPATTAQQNIDYAPVQIYDLSIAPLMMDGQASVNYQVSEPMKVVTKIYRPGVTPPVDVYSTSADGLVKRIIGVRPSRTLISESWDGTDFTLSRVPDGNYPFRVAGSTMTGAVDTLTGNIVYGARIANYMDENIPVIRSGTSDLCGDFARETFFAPNPYTGENGWFHIPVAMNGNLTLKIYNIAGDLVYEKDYGPRGGGQNVNGRDVCAAAHTDPACWPRVNSYGRRVAPGVYLAVVRFEATEGTRDVCQAVKKILVP